MRIAIVGGGISGMVAAHLLHPAHEITLFESDGSVGGHAHTVTVEQGGRTHAVDTGFIVFNQVTYPAFVRLLRRLDVPWRETDMSFSVRSDADGLEYSSAGLNALFAQRSNLLRLSFYGLLRDVVRFNRAGRAFLEQPQTGMSLGEFLAAAAFSPRFVERYIVPMGAAIWSADPVRMTRFPAHSFLRFFHNHGLLWITRRFPWQTVVGGSRRYVERLVAPFRDRIRLNAPVTGIRRDADRVTLHVRGAAPEHFDRVVLATHSDQALRLLETPTSAEREVLGAIPYQRNEVVLHTDASLLPRNRRAWASWNYHIPAEPRRAATVTYNLSMLQGLDTPQPFCVTLNDGERIDPRKVLRRLVYHHPVYTAQTFAAQERRREISGPLRTHYCGAYWGYGFHEDGVQSALAVGRELDVDVEARL